MEGEDLHCGEGIKSPQASMSYLHQYEEIPVNHYTDLQVTEGYNRPPYPPGIRFNPTDEELIAFYLNPKVHGGKIPCNIVIDVDLYKYHPKDLTENFKSIVKDAWYIFTSRNRKYANGCRPNRSAGSGYWKAAGSDQEIIDKKRNRIGYKKSLVYHEGRQPSKDKTGWMMHEYRIDESNRPANPAEKTMLVIDESNRPANPAEKTMLLDNWVLCKIYYKPTNHSEGSKGNSAAENDTSLEEIREEKPSEQTSELNSEPLEPPLDSPYLDELLSNPPVDVYWSDSAI